MTTTGVNVKLQHQQQHSIISLTKKKKKKPLLPWPTRHSLPPLQDSVLKGLKEERLEFPINEACTSITIVPSGRHVVAGFTDGTLRLFELNGTFIQHKMPPGNDSSAEDDDDDEEEEAIFDIISTKSTMVCSKTYQRYGAVACQIHAKGVHTSLIMKVDVSPDGLYAFGGVARGSMELVAVDLSKLQDQTGDILDHISVETHSDAKLRGFGACTRLKGTNKYLLLTGKGIKNIHIWAFSPLSKNHKWECLYDTQTNGNTITFLHFRYHTSGHLQALSKSDGQKVRVWDLQHEQQRRNKDIRPKRPPFTDIPSTESALGIAGNFCLGGCHSITLVNLDILESTMNYTELPLPGSNIRRVGRQQRGELQTLQSVVCLSMDGSHALLEMSDGSILQYSQGQHMPQLNTIPSTLFRTNGEQRSNSDLDSTSTLGLARIGANGTVVAAMATHTTAGKGAIVLRMMQGSITEQETPLKLKKGISMSVVTPAKRIIEDSPERKDQKEYTAASPDSMGQPEKKHMFSTGIAVSPEHSKADSTPVLKNYVAMKTFFEPKASKKGPVVKEAMRQQVSKLLALVTECNPIVVLANELTNLKTDDKILSAKSIDGDYMLKATDHLTKVESAVVITKANLADSLTKIRTVHNVARVKSINDSTKIISSDSFAAERHTKTKPTNECTKIKSTENGTMITSAQNTNKVKAFFPTDGDSMVKASFPTDGDSMVKASFPTDGDSMVKTSFPTDGDPMVKAIDLLTKLESADVLTKANLTDSLIKIRSVHNVAKVKSTNDFTKIISSDSFAGERHTKTKSANDRIKFKSTEGGNKITSAQNVNKAKAFPTDGDSMVKAIDHIAKLTSADDITKRKLADGFTKIRSAENVTKVKSADNITKLTSPDSFAAERHTKIKSFEDRTKITPAQSINKIKTFVPTDIDSMVNGTDHIAKLTSADDITKCKPADGFTKIRSAVNVTKITSADTLIKLVDDLAKVKSSKNVFKIRSASHKSLENILERTTPGSCTIIKSPDNIVKLKSAKKLLTKKLTKRPSKTGRSKSPLLVPRKRVTESIDIRCHSGNEQDAVDALLSVCEKSGTPVPKKVRAEVSENNHIPLILPPSLAREISKSDLRRRAVRLNEMTGNPSFEVTRMKLALEHRAAHELIRKRVLSNVDTIIRSLASQSTLAAEEARGWLEEIIQNYQDVLDDILGRQRLEAGALAACQTLSNEGQPVASLAVSFPFPEVFDQARESLSSFLVKRRRLSP